MLLLLRNGSLIQNLLLKLMQVQNDKEKLLTDKRYCEEVFKLFLKKKAIKEDKIRAFKKHIDKSISNLPTIS